MPTATLPVPQDMLNKAHATWSTQLLLQPTTDDATSKGLGGRGSSVDFGEFLDTQGTEYTRPNGERYVPRKLKIDGVDAQDVTFVRMAYDARMPILLFGAPGCGKTALVEAALDDLVTVQGTLETETADFIGSWAQQTDGTYKWVDGPLLVAAENGLPLLIDEVALIDPRVMAVVYGVMDGRDRIDVTANPERGSVSVKGGFCVFGACNPDVPGAVMSDALLSRFTVHVEMGTDWRICTDLGIPSEITTVARNLHKKAKTSEVMAPPQIRELLAFKKTAGVFGVTIALRNFVAQARAEDRDHFKDAIKAVYRGTDDLEMLTF